jgi:drug/metabolite transporter (DMT)-like permease
VLAFETAGTITAAIASQTYPLFSILMEFLFFKKKKKIAELIFTLIMLIGIYYLGTEGTWLINGFSPWFGLALLVPLLWSIAHVSIKNVLDISPITPNQVTFFRVLVSTIILFFLNLIIYGPSSLFNGIFNYEFQIFGFFMGLVYYLELVNWFYAVKHVEVSVASAITVPTPVITLLLAVFLINETVEPFEMISLFIVLISLYGVLWSGRVKNRS